MGRRVIHSLQAPKPIGAYSQAIQVDAGRNLTFLAGQTPISPDTGELVQGDIRRQTEQVMENLKAVLDSAGLDFSHVVRCGIFLTDLKDFSAVNEVYGSYFLKAPPARTTVQVSALPKGASVEIEAIAAS